MHIDRHTHRRTAPSGQSPRCQADCTSGRDHYDQPQSWPTAPGGRNGDTGWQYIQIKEKETKAEGAMKRNTEKGMVPDWDDWRGKKKRRELERGEWRRNRPRKRTRLKEKGKVISLSLPAHCTSLCSGCCCLENSKLWDPFPSTIWTRTPDFSCGWLFFGLVRSFFPPVPAYPRLMFLFVSVSEMASADRCSTVSFELVSSKKWFTWCGVFVPKIPVPVLKLMCLSVSGPWNL